MICKAHLLIQRQYKDGITSHVNDCPIGAKYNTHELGQIEVLEKHQTEGSDHTWFMIRIADTALPTNFEQAEYEYLQVCIYPCDVTLDEKQNEPPMCYIFQKQELKAIAELMCKHPYSSEIISLGEQLSFL